MKKQVGKDKEDPGLTPFDPAEFLDNEEAMATYMSEALATGDASFVADALGVIARAKGMTQVAKEAGLSRESLYRALRSDGNPELGTVLKVMSALHLTVEVKANGDVGRKVG